ncbi:putative zinc-binding metallopeptidase [Polaromonas sp.]|uniref:zinc-binding metallopeptidase family protein n=1 Tax=Polaromonas sp. TaxID=1869339 RepID=UPI00286AAB2A|nr:putative zinc-binding metallopeptidase [Polaromonas sp.]
MSSTTSFHPAPSALPLLAGRNYHCQCGQPVFFRNSKCLACGTPLGYDCEKGLLLPLMPGPQPGSWQAWQALRAPASPPPDDASPPQLQDIPGQESASAPAAPQAGAAPEPADAEPVPVPADEGQPFYKRCLNLSTPASCNWLIALQDPLDMCRACRLNRTIPDLTDPAQPDNGYLWGLLELAKRRLVSSLILLGLPVASRMSEDSARGLMFDFLRSPNGGPHVLTGHHTGLITLNVDEADDAHREAVRKALREPYRTLLGHFRHEVGHYYWDRLVQGTPWMDGFRALFGDESRDYPASLQQNYEQGPPPQWWLHYVSAYASSHPWEDWAECWAHYLHMRDTIDTAQSFGLQADRAQLEFTAFTLDALYQPDHPEAQRFLDFLNDWTRLTTLLNEMSRSMGQPDFYPFVLPHEVVAKLHFIHLLVSSGDAPAPPSASQF